MIAKHVWVWLALAAGGIIAAAGCTDPGCIRNSECGPRYYCREAMCVLSPVDGGLDLVDDEDAGR